MIIDYTDNCRVTFMNQLDKTATWKEWKQIKDCNNDELKQINLISLPTKYILLDKDFGKEPVDKNIINEDYKQSKQKLLSLGINNWVADNSRNGYHIFIPTSNLESINDEEVRNKIRELYIDAFDCDFAKKSLNGVISIPNRPHFKTMINHGVIEVVEGDIYTIPNGKISVAKSKVSESKKYNAEMLVDKDFEHYFETDAFFSYIKNNIIPDGTSRWNTILPNLAIAAIKSGKPDDEINAMLRPILAKSLPGKSYSEFKGWLKKARKEEINDYNAIQLNNWAAKYTKIPQFYELKVKLNAIEELEKEDKKNTLFKVYKDSELEDMEYTETEWLVEDWLPKGDISFFVGKSASYKTTLCLHLAYAISTGSLVFNKYKTQKTNVLYLNEENAPNLFMGMRNRIKGGLEIDKADVFVTLMDGIRLDKTEYILSLIEYINDNKIGLMVCDSFRRFIGFDENNATEMNNLFNFYKYLRKHCPGLTIINIHHLKKFDPSKTMDMRDALRGSSDIVNNADSIIGVKRKAGFDQVIIQHIKNRSAHEKQPVMLMIENIEEENKTYIYESEKSLNPGKLGDDGVELCAKEILNYIDTKGIKEFKSKLIKDTFEVYNEKQIQRALSILSNGPLPSLKTEGVNKGKKYIRLDDE
jgi:archaellum biogenesis ATPase FlaH